MKKFIIEEDFWELFPKAKVGVAFFHGINNEIKDTKKYEEMLGEAEKEALKYISEDILSSNDVVKVWRDAFLKFKTKKGARASIEAMLKRVQKGNAIGTINPAVDIYNYISLKYALPCGGEDIDTFVGNIRLTRAIGDEEFITLGTDKSESPFEGEIIYKDDAGAICRCWNWRESVRTMLTEKTKNAFFCIESVDEDRECDLLHAVNELAELLADNLGGTYQTAILDKYNKEITIEE